MIIREMLLTDVEDVHRIEKQAHPFPCSKKIITEAVTSSKHAVVLERDDEIVGFAILSFVVGEVELLNICINPSHQGKGFGKYLLDALIEHAIQSGNQDMYLEVRESNDKAYQLYLNLGFNEIGRRKGYYPINGGREDAILMALPLNF